MQETFKNVVGTLIVNQEDRRLKSFLQAEEQLDSASAHSLREAQSQAIRGNTVKYFVCQNVDYNLINSVQ